MKTSTIAKLIIAFWMVSAPIMAQTGENKVKSLFVYNFIRYIQWPQTEQDVTIGVLGHDADLMAAFNEMASKKTASGGKIIIKEFSNPAESESYHLVFIPASNSKVIRELSNLNKTLIVTEKPGLAKQGSDINFVNQDGKIRFEMNVQKIESTQLKVSSQLKSLAIAI
ncbi:YfiR family protein [Fulvivirga lutimaris]|uniref:YfiR family protein n=1 Tax=Fulvivirga lutimaris TaxID=1819566 RepID=UPI0012BBF0DE|nr:YfiR family protein [Fulvivirga lutimaris]MTI39747.1 YfiR family protein [Fulvivirga lutimaris]